jgi:SAM-dependent MidA family methyltransferase
VIC